MKEKKSHPQPQSCAHIHHAQSKAYHGPAEQPADTPGLPQPLSAALHQQVLHSVSAGATRKVLVRWARARVRRVGLVLHAV